MMESNMTNTQMLLIMLGFMASLVSFLATIVSILVLGRIKKVETNQEDMAKDWMGRNETNSMVKRVHDEFMKRYSDFEKKLDASNEDRAKEISDMMKGVKEEIHICSQNIIKQVMLAMRVNSGEKITATDVLAQANAAHE